MIKERKNESGFTLIELMIVIAIIGVLAAIAIPMFSSYQIKSYNSTALADLRNLQTTQISLNADNGDYEPLGITVGNGTPVTVGNTTISISNKNSICASVDATKTSFIVISKHTKGDTAYAYDSDSSLIYKNEKLLAPGAKIAAVIDATLNKDDLTGVGDWVVK